MINIMRCLVFNCLRTHSNFKLMSWGEREALEKAIAVKL